MTHCIYCLNPLALNGASDDPRSPSLEHVVPWALGGSNDCATREVCKDCNNTLGRTIDAACINHPFVEMLRQRFGIASYSRKVPDVELKTRSKFLNEPANVCIPPTGDIRIEHEPIVIRQKSSSSEEILVAGLEGDVKNIVEGIARGAKKSGKILIDPMSGQPLDIAQAIQCAPRDKFSSYQGRIFVDKAIFGREIAKIAFGFSHLILGWEWTGSDLSKSMRDVARGLGGRRQVLSLVKDAKLEMRMTLPKGKERPNDHLLSIVPCSEPYIFVSLFGNPLLTGSVRLDVEYPALINRFALNRPILAIVDHQERKTTWVEFAEYAAHISRF